MAVFETDRAGEDPLVETARGRSWLPTCPMHQVGYFLCAEGVSNPKNRPGEVASVNQRMASDGPCLWGENVNVCEE